LRYVIVNFHEMILKNLPSLSWYMYFVIYEMPTPVSGCLLWSCSEDAPGFEARGHLHFVCIVDFKRYLHKLRCCSAVDAL